MGVAFTVAIVDGVWVVYRTDPGHPPQRFAPEAPLEAIVRALGEDPELTDPAAGVAATNKEFALHADAVIAVREAQRRETR